MGLLVIGLLSDDFIGSWKLEVGNLLLVTGIGNTQ